MTDRSLREVHGLEDEAHDGRHLDDFTAHQTQLLVVVQHRVHVLDPHGVDRPVEHDPLAVGRRQRRVLTERVRRYAVRPLHEQETSVHLFIRLRPRSDGKCRQRGRCDLERKLFLVLFLLRLLLLSFPIILSLFFYFLIPLVVKIPGVEN